MRLLVVCPHFAPDVAPTGEVITSIVEGLAARGHHLDVVTALPWYRKHQIEPGWEGRARRVERTAWGSITRLHPFPTDKANIPARALAFGGFTALAAADGLVARHRPDAVLAMSPPLTLGLAGWVAAAPRRVPLVFNIQDVFPDAAVEVGALKNPKVIRAASVLERVSYQLADAVTVLSDDLRDNVTAKLDGRRRGDASKVRVIPNFVDTDRIRPMERHTGYRAEHGLGDRTVVMYAGNVGFSQSLDLVVHAARALAEERPDVVFVINGGGSARAQLEADAAGLENVVFVDMQPRERLPEVLASADLHVVPLRRGLARASVPSKLYSILAAARPVLASVDPGTEVARTVERAGAGVAVPPDEPAAFLDGLRRLLADLPAARVMGEAGRAFVEGWASPAAVAERYDELFTELRSARPEASR